jgi:hypothetical protein
MPIEKIATPNEEEWILLRESNFEDIFEDCKDNLLDSFKEDYPFNETDYDIQENARKFLSGFAKRTYVPFTPIKLYCFREGKNYSKILKAGSYLLRDYFLQTILN